MESLDSFKEKVINALRALPKKSRFPFEFLKNSLFQRWVIAIGLCLILALMMAPDINISEPKYTLGMIAPKNIKADHAFLVEDKQAVERKKIEDAESVKPVYDYDNDIPKNIKLKLAKAFSSAGARLKTQTGANNTEINLKELQAAKKMLESSLGIYLNSEEFFILNENRFSDDLLEKLSLVIDSFYENRYIAPESFGKTEKEKGIVIRNLKTQIREDLADTSSLIAVHEIDEPLQKTVNMVFGNQPGALKDAAFSLTKKMIEPNLTLNKVETQKSKLAVIDEANASFFRVQKNEMIVREGEKIGYLELAKLNAFLQSSRENKIARYATLLGFFLTALFLSVALYLWRTRNWSKTTTRSNLDLLVFGIIALLQIILIKAGIFIAQAVNRSFPAVPTEACYFAIPFAFGAMTIAILINRNVALIISALTSFLIGFIFDEKITFPLFSFMGSVAASYQIVRIRQRSVFLKIGLFLGLINMAAVFCLNLATGDLFNDLPLRLIMGFGGGILTGIIVAGVTPVFESLFGFITDIKLLELANLNQPLFQKMIIEAPGTYHHSIIVASLVEAAAESIGANALLAKVSAYYHDIGKLNKPLYFIENQTSSENKHDKLSPKMSSLIIMAHVKDGCEIAAREKLGRPIINIIRQHHGTSLVSYFYDKAKKDKDESIRSLPETDFRYPGPKPQTKEAGLVMLGDVVEASSRTLTNPTPARIRSLVRERIEAIYMDGQLDECELTLSNLNTIAEAFIKILTGIFHHRVDYPETAPKESNGKKDTHEHPNR
jgi:putative nucleotidyltransferase with HDIG domain